MLKKSGHECGVRSLLYFSTKNYLSIVWRCLIISKNHNELMLNDEIKEKEIRLVGSDGEMIGIVPTKEALQMASDKNLDLAKIAPQAIPPVCKIMDYGKYLFELNKKEKEARKKQKIISIKEVRISPSIEEHDFGFKVKNACKFLKEGDKVKVTVKFRGRELNHASLGTEVLGRFAESVKDFGIVEKKPKLEGRSMIMVLNPK